MHRIFHCRNKYTSLPGTSWSENAIVCSDLMSATMSSGGLQMPAGSSQCPAEAPNGRRKSGHRLKREQPCVLGSVVSIRELRWGPNVSDKLPMPPLRSQCLREAPNDHRRFGDILKLERPCVLGPVVSTHGLRWDPNVSDELPMSATATNASIGIKYTHSKSELCTARTTLCTRICLRKSRDPLKRERSCVLGSVL